MSNYLFNSTVIRKKPPIVHIVLWIDTRCEAQLTRNVDVALIGCKRSAPASCDHFDVHRARCRVNDSLHASAVDEAMLVQLLVDPSG